MTVGLYRVGAVRCSSYDAFPVAEALDLALLRAGGLPALESPVLLKANLLAPRRPEDGVTTHPAVLAALADRLNCQGIEDLTVSDSPGYIFQDQWEILFQRTGMDQLKGKGVKLRPLVDEGLVDVPLPGRSVLSSARVGRLYLEAPSVINVAKLKTHVETEMTGCVKNLFGIADTATRKLAHRSPSLERLAQAIVDLYSVREPHWHILDAIVAMEGNGPSRGRPVTTGWLVASANGLAADIVGAVIMGYENPWEIPLIKAASGRGMGPQSFEEIDLPGVAWQELPHPRFRRSSRTVRWMPTSLRGWAHGLVCLRPHLDPASCTGCGICGKVCPVDAIEMKERRPVIDQLLCARCLCCHEMCPEGAMKVKRNLLSRLV